MIARENSSLTGLLAVGEYLTASSGVLHNFDLYR